ncbi:hypothetical protein ACFZCP_14270 [Streptomyces sp. NPDC007971]|uniref:hypothetical protein n=1 Tax=Streptomyces sp. NPDC007971 TaxID=3364799 RepID=UPI0036E62D46
MSDNEYLLAGDPLLGNQGFGYVGRTNRGWAALPHGRDGLKVFGFRSYKRAQAASTSIVLYTRNLLGGSVSDLFDSHPLYEGLHYEDPSEKRDWTVTIAGSERHDGEAPYTYVVSAETKQQAWATALSTHIRREESVDCFIVPEKSHEGVPAENCGYHWNDLRLQSSFWAKLQEIVDLIKKFDEEDKPYRDEDGYLIDEKQEDHDDLVGNYEMDAFPMVEDLAHYAGHI